MLVIGEDPEYELAPFHEYECTGLMDEFVVFVKADESYDDYEKFKAEHPEYAVEYTTYEIWLEKYWGYKFVEGEWGRYTNPNAKWDWYVLGGRWRGMITVKHPRNGTQGELGVFEALNGADPQDPHQCDQTRLINIDWDGLKQFQKTEAENAWNRFQELLKKEPNADHSWRTNVIAGETKRQYIARMLKEFPLSTYAMVKDRTWYGKGDMGWFGSSTNEVSSEAWDKKVEEMVKSLPDNTLISIYDLHI